MSPQKIVHQVGTEGFCKLCGNWESLSRSHILSGMAYDDVIDHASHPRMIVVRDVEDGPVSDKSRQTGFWERLLCEKCEQQFSKYETYASNSFLNIDLPAANPANPVIKVRVNDYRKFKLFLMSLLWRVGVARGPFFRCVDLGPHELRLRGMLNAEDPGEPDDYGCLITPLLPEPDASLEKIITMPATTRVDGHNGCLLVLRGFVFQYFISQHGIAPGVKQAFLNKQGEMLMMWARGTQFPPLRELWGRGVRAIRREAEAEENSSPLEGDS